jgi:hypothetical protein
MVTNCIYDWEDDWEDDWENTEIPDLIVNLQETIKNRERQLKLLEEQKMMEEAELVLSEELFDEEKRNKRTNANLALAEPIKFVKTKKEKPKQLQIEQEKRRQELQEKQKQQSQKQKEKKKQDKRLKDIYGDAELDEYDEMYGDIEDRYR